MGFVSCVAVGDILNNGKNYLVVITADGWCYIYSSITEFFAQTVESSESSERTEEAKEEVRHLKTVELALIHFTYAGRWTNIFCGICRKN